MNSNPELIPTSVVGSYPQPGWLIDRDKLGARVPRIRMPEIWRVAPEFLDEAQDDATRLAIRDMEEAGIDIVTDGEMRRESYSNRFATALDGVDIDRPGTIVNRIGKQSVVPRIVGPIARREPILARDLEFLRRYATRRIKITLPGPFTMSCQADDEHYGDPEALALGFAAVVNEELRDLAAAGADVIQLDEPWLDARPEQARRYAVKAIDRALEGVDATTVVHVCFGYAAAVSDKPAAYSFLGELGDSAAAQISIEAAQPALDLGILRDLGNKTIVLGVIDLGAADVETDETVAARIREGLRYLSPDRIVAAPDCGMKYLPRDRAFAKLAALNRGAGLVRREL